MRRATAVLATVVTVLLGPSTAVAQAAEPTVRSVSEYAVVTAEGRTGLAIPPGYAVDFKSGTVTKVVRGARAFSDCANYSDVVCFWWGTSYTGTIWRQTRSQMWWRNASRCTNVADLQAGAANNFESYYNHMLDNTWVVMLTGRGCTGAVYHIAPGTYRATMPVKAGEYDWRNVVDSLQVYQSCDVCRQVPPPSPTAST